MNEATLDPLREYRGLVVATEATIASHGLDPEQVGRQRKIIAASVNFLDSVVEARRCSREARVAVLGLGYAGLPMAVACAEAGYPVLGLDVDLVPVAADARLFDDRHPRLVLVVPERDDHTLLRRLAERLREPAEVQTVPDDWRAP